MLDARFSHLYFYQSLNRLQRGLSATAELLVNECQKITFQILKIGCRDSERFLNSIIYAVYRVVCCRALLGKTVLNYSLPVFQITKKQNRLLKIKSIQQSQHFARLSLICKPLMLIG